MFISLKDISNNLKDFDFMNWELVHNAKTMNKDVAKENIIILKGVFERYKIKYWLCFGTLLGAIRENDFIIHDVDTDVGLEFKEIRKLEVALPDLMNHGFEIIRVNSDFSVVTILRNDEYIDLCLFSKVKGSEVISWACSGYIVKQDYFSELSSISFLGKKFPVPVNYIEYLSEVYGEDWRTPKPNAHALAIDITQEIYKQYYFILNKWLELNINGVFVSELLKNKGINEIVIYGIGTIGERLIQDIEKNDYIEIIGLLDKDATNNIYNGYKILTKEQLANLEKATVIVTPFYHFNSIKMDLMSVNDRLLVLGIDEILVDEGD